MKTLGIRTPNREQAEFVLGALHDGSSDGRFHLDDIALAVREPDGKLELHKHSSWMHRHTIDKHLLKQGAELLEPGEAIVVARGDEQSVDAIGARARALTKGDMRTYELTADGPNEVTGVGAVSALPDEEGLLREASDEIPLQTGMLVKMDFS
jgi:hypothetical protein